MTSYAALRSALPIDRFPSHDGRIGYYADRSDYQVSTATNTGLSRRWRIDTFSPVTPGGPPRWSLTAIDTQRPGQPAGGDYFMMWAYQPLILCGINGKTTPKLWGVGSWYEPEEAGEWLAEQLTWPDGRVFTRLQSLANPGWYLCHARNDGSNPDVYDPLVISDHVDPATGGLDLCWTIEDIPAPASEALSASATA